MKSGRRWKNWAGNQHCNATIVTPRSTEELVKIIKKAHQEQRTVHAYGASHSWSDIVCVDPTDYLINTHKLNSILALDIEKKQVVVQAGIKLKKLNSFLAKQGLCLSNQGAITKQSLAGAISTATHGSGKTGTLASFITSVKLLIANGTFKNISPVNNKNLWPAVRTSIGSLGIITELTVQCEPMFNLKREYVTSDWKSILKNYESYLSTNDYMEFTWNVDDSVEIKLHNKVIFETHDTDYSYKKLSGVLNKIYMEEEIAIPRSQFIHAAKAARKLVQESYKQHTMFDNILFRFVAEDKNNILSPASNEDVVYFSITTEHKKGYEDFYKKFYRAMLPFKGRPHWGKINYLTHEDAHVLYGENFKTFIDIRKKLDPKGMFSNNFTRRIFGW